MYLFEVRQEVTEQSDEDVTDNLMTIRSLPKKIENAPAFLEVRGEVYMSFDSFNELVKEQEDNEEKPFKKSEKCRRRLIKGKKKF